MLSFYYQPHQPNGPFHSCSLSKTHCTVVFINKRKNHLPGALCTYFTINPFIILSLMLLTLVLVSIYICNF